MRVEKGVGDGVERATLMDKLPSCAIAVVGAAVASVVFGGSLVPKARAVEEPPAMPAATASSSVACARAGAVRNVAPAVPPAGPSDAQVNAAGTSAAGGAGTVAGDVRGDPCEPAKRFENARPAASAAASVSTPTTLNRR